MIACGLGIWASGSSSCWIPAKDEDGNEPRLTGAVQLRKRPKLAGDTKSQVICADFPSVSMGTNFVRDADNSDENKKTASKGSTVHPVWWHHANCTLLEIMNLCTLSCPSEADFFNSIPKCLAQTEIHTFLTAAWHSVPAKLLATTV